MRVRLRAVLVLSVIVAVHGENRLDHPEEWQLWKTEHGKSYGSQREELERHLVWLANREYINTHNKNAHVTGFTLHLNQYADWSDKEFLQTYLTYYVSDDESGGGDGGEGTRWLVGSVKDLPLTMDWKRAGVVTKVKEQGQCGSSYAFSSAGAIEGAWARKYGKLANISAQNIIDCSGRYGNRGCYGGNMKASFRYVSSNKGVNSEIHYPYRARKLSCQYNSGLVVASISGSKRVLSGNETQLQLAVANIGPISVAVDASSRAFRFYYRGVYRSQLCSTSNLNHAMLVTGYGTANKRDYWLVKNSWGEYWGIDGYILMARNMSNECGIASDASFPTLN